MDYNCKDKIEMNGGNVLCNKMAKVLKFTAVILFVSAISMINGF